MSTFQSESGLIGFWHIIVSLGVLFAGMFVLVGRRSLRETTLKTAWTWSLLAATVWTATWFADQCAAAMSSAVADHAWYACAVLSLCPPIAVLGSRRPGTRVWTWFILLPMLLALSWPIGALWLQGSELRRLQLETPQLIAFCLVLIMGVGNYCGTRFTLPALLYGGSNLTIVISSSARSPWWLADQSSTRFWCTVVMVLAIGFVRMSPRRFAPTRFDRLWFDFFDTFGIVWGRRIQDRVNYIAHQERLPVRLELDGFVLSQAPDASSAPVPADGNRTRIAGPTHESANTNGADVDARIEHILRWLLRRFVDASWIDKRLDSRPDSQVSPLAADS